ncbi:hypothetical protein [Vibrio sp. CyArs1]|uniref:hypothetical protein n=1 Tax=Vibrio sp. CyArs1 TaxID=2682577 RepID=UPI001F063C60|nr:hypothetical protein [Vibrio sp. CyArs1]
MKFVKSALTLSIVSVLAACGGSDDDSGTSSVNSYALQGKVVDGYIYQALVWIDINQNSVRDSSDPQAKSGLDGSYTLELSEEQQNKLVGLPILAEITNESVDVGDTPPATESELQSLLEVGTLKTVFSASQTSHFITLSMPPLSKADLTSLESQGSLEGGIINPFTTEAHEAIQSTLNTMLDQNELDSLTSEQMEAFQNNIDSLVKKAVDDKVAEIKQSLSSNLSDEALVNLLTGDFILEGGDAKSELMSAAESKVSAKVTLENEIKELETLNPGAEITKESDSGTWVFTPEHTDLEISVRYEWEEIEKKKDGVTEYEYSETTYYTPEGADEQVYSQFTEVYSQDSNGSYTEKHSYQADLNLDGTLDYSSFFYDVGTETKVDGVTIDTYERYFDESNPGDIVGNNIVEDIPERNLTYDSVDALAAAIESGDLSGVDSKQMITRNKSATSEYEFTTVNMTEFKVSDSSDLSVASYKEYSESWEYFTGAEKNVVYMDWNADDTFNSIDTVELNADDSEVYRYQQPVWNWDGSESSEYQFNYWQDWTVEISEDSNGHEVVRNFGSKSLLDESTNSPELDDQNETQVFHKWDETTVERSSTDIRTLLKWNHYELTGHSFFKNESGQKYSVTIDGTTTTYPEYWGQYAADLDEFVNQLVDEGLNSQEIWLKVINESIRGIRRTEGFEWCDVDIEGDSATADNFSTQLANCGGALSFTVSDVQDSRLTRRKSSDTEVRFWTLYSNGSSLRETWKSSGNTSRSNYSWTVNSSGHLVLTNDDNTFTRTIVPYFKGEHGAGVLVLDKDSYEPQYDAIWSAYFTDTWGLYIPTTPEIN